MNKKCSSISLFFCHLENYLMLIEWNVSVVFYPLDFNYHWIIMYTISTIPVKYHFSSFLNPIFYLFCHWKHAHNHFLTKQHWGDTSTNDGEIFFPNLKDAVNIGDSLNSEDSANNMNVISQCWKHYNECKRKENVNSSTKVWCSK